MQTCFPICAHDSLLTSKKIFYSSKKYEHFIFNFQLYEKIFFPFNSPHLNVVRWNQIHSEIILQWAHAKKYFLPRKLFQPSEQLRTRKSFKLHGKVHTWRKKKENSSAWRRKTRVNTLKTPLNPLKMLQRRQLFNVANYDAPGRLSRRKKKEEVTASRLPK